MENNENNIQNNETDSKNTNNKKTHKIILCVIIILLIIAAIVGVYFLTNQNNKNSEEKAPLAEATDEEQKQLPKELPEQLLKLESLSLANNFYDSNNEEDISYYIATLNGDLAYSLDYGAETQDNTSMTFRDYVSDQGMAVLMNGYPNNSFEALGCLNEEEAYLATQMAFWEIMNRTGESEKATKIFRVDNVVPTAENEDSYKRITDAAKKLVTLAEEDPYNKVPTMNVHNGNVGTETKDDGYVYIGPYSITISGTDAKTVKSITASLKNAPASATIVDINGNIKSTINDGEEIYVRCNVKEPDITFQINFKTDVDRMVGAIYKQSNEKLQDYAKLDIEPTSIEKDLTIEWTKVVTKGRIELIVTDKDNRPVADAEFSLLDSYGNIIMETVKSGKDGVIDFYDVPAGEYTINQTSAPEGYEIKESSKKVTVTAGELTTIRFEN